MWPVACGNDSSFIHDGKWHKGCIDTYTEEMQIGQYSDTLDD